MHLYAFSAVFVFFLDSTSVRLVFDQKAGTDFFEYLYKNALFLPQKIKGTVPKSLFETILFYSVFAYRPHPNLKPETLKL